MPFRLTLNVDEEVQRYALQRGENLIGADSACEVVVADPTVSRHHASLIVVSDGDEERLELADLGSLNGTWIEHERLSGKRALSDGSAVRFGSIGGRVEAVASGDVVAWTDGSSSEAADSRAPAAADSPVLDAQDDTARASSAPGTTASVGPLSLFTLGQLPMLLDSVAEGLAVQLVAARVGEALLTSLPLTDLEIGRRIGDHLVGWYEASAEPGTTNEAKGTEWKEVVRAAVELRARFTNAEAARLFSPVLSTAATLIALADTTSVRPAFDGDGEGVGQAPSAAKRAPSPPDPPTLEPSVRVLYQRAAQVARGDVNVLIRGESGTGKELLARFLHDASHRHDGAFVALNCAALPRDLQETELFGIEKGVATGVDARPGKFEQADGGTLFLDEIGDMAKEVQAKILRVLQEGEVFRIGGSQARPARARILSATHQDVTAMIERGEFRSDLFHRIADWQAVVPPLRERRRDVPNLVYHFLQRASSDDGLPAVEVSADAMEALSSYSWPGNVRQLEREVIRARLFVASGGLLDTECLSEPVRSHRHSAVENPTLKYQLHQHEGHLLLRALEAADGDVSAAAELLEVPVSTLYRKLRAHGIQ